MEYPDFKEIANLEVYALHGIKPFQIMLMKETEFVVIGSVSNKIGILNFKEMKYIRTENYFESLLNPTKLSKAFQMPGSKYS